MTFRERYGPWALVAGASEGLGAAWAHEIAGRGLNVVLVARRPDRLEAFADEVRRRHGVEVRAVAADLARDDVMDTLRPVLDAVDVGLVVYNACASFIGPYLDLPMAQKLATLDVNTRGLVRVTSEVAPRLVARGRGGLVVVSSMSGFQGSAMVGVYAATKAFDTVLGEVLWEELGHHGVDVLVCAAGATLTPNFVSQTPADRQGAAYPMPPEDVARGALDALERAGPTWIPGTLNRAAQFVLARLVPRRTAVRFISGTTRRMYRDRGAS